MNKINRTELVRIAVVGAAASLCWMHAPQPAMIAAGALAFGAFPVFREALTNLYERRMTMELSMSIALVAALAISEYVTALIIALFVLIAESLEHLTTSRGRSAIQELLKLLPQTVFLHLGDAIEQRSVDKIKAGDVVLVKPGARVPVDGVVVSGHTQVDQSTITGESLPVEKFPGETVFACTINQSGTIDVETRAVGEDTAFGKIIHAVETAEQFQAPVEKIADRLSGWLVYFALGCAALTFLVTHNATSTISVVIVAGACGIAAGTPLAILGGIGRAARGGTIIKGGLFLESLANIDAVVFDKTGTITLGTPLVTTVEIFNDGTREQVLRIAAAAELASEHPLGRAIVEQATREKIVLERTDHFQYTLGRGICCTVGSQEVAVGSRNWFAERNFSIENLPVAPLSASEVLVAVNGRILGSIHLADVVRPEAKETVTALANLNIESFLVTGDSKGIADAIAQQVGIRKVAAELLPVEKREFVRGLARSGRRVAMLGDGVNDAPALTEALVGVAVGSGTDVAKECADVVLIGSDLSRFVDAVQIARRCKRVIMANFIGTLGIDVVGVGMAALGLLSPVVAALIHVVSELLFIMNSARLLPRRSNSRNEICTQKSVVM